MAGLTLVETQTRLIVSRKWFAMAEAMLLACTMVSLRWLHFSMAKLSYSLAGAKLNGAVLRVLLQIAGGLLHKETPFKHFSWQTDT